MFKHAVGVHGSKVCVNSTLIYAPHKVRPIINTNASKFNNNYNIVNYISTVSYLVFAYFMPNICWISLLTTTNHKMVGITYAYMLISIALVFTTLVAMIRLIISVKVVSSSAADIYNTVISIHGVIMVFFYIMPVLIGVVANILLPISIGSIEVAYPKLNNVSMLLWALSVIILLMCGLVNNNVINAGWTLYPPLSTSLLLLYNNGVLMLCILLLVNGTSSNISALNFIVSIYNIGAPGFTLVYVNLYVWVINIIMALLMVVLPVLTGILCMIMADVAYNTVFFDYSIGGDVVLFQHMFWFFGHPEVYIIILPAFGVISQIIPAFSRKPLFGYASMVYATAAIAFLSFIVWAHHMYTVGMPVAGELFFMYATMLIAVPTGVKVFNWVTTMWRGAMTFETPMLFSIGFLVLFTIGGFTGLMLSIAPADFQYHDTYFVVAHFHYVMVAGAVFSMTAAIYFWLPKWTGRMYNETMGKVHFWVSFIGFNVTFFPQHFVGLAGMPRRIPDYALQFADFNMMSSIGAFIYGASQLLFLYNVIAAIVAGKRVSDEKVWDGAEGLEWTLPSPPPYHTFETPPKIEEQPAH